MKKFAEKFYKSRNWKQTREAYLRSVGGLCEICLREGKHTPARIVHHIIPIDENTINDPKVTLSWDNFLAVCDKCHEDLHHNLIKAPMKRETIDLRPMLLTSPKRYKIDELTGRITIL